MTSFYVIHWFPAVASDPLQQQQASQGSPLRAPRQGGCWAFITKTLLLTHLRPLPFHFMWYLKIIDKIFYIFTSGSGQDGVGEEWSSAVSRSCWHPTVADGVGCGAGWPPPPPWGKCTLKPLHGPWHDCFAMSSLLSGFAEESTSWY